jgi:hypothetical protein
MQARGGMRRQALARLKAGRGSSAWSRNLLEKLRIQVV